MRRLLVVLAVVVTAAMGSGREAPPPTVPTRANPPSAAEVAAAQGSSQGAELAIADQLPIRDAAEAGPEAYLWEYRPVVVFANSPEDPAFLTQMRALEAGIAALIERDVVVIVDTDPAAMGVWRQRLTPHGFSLVVIDKDGQVKQRKPAPWDVREITRAIDKFPLRRQEIGRAGMLP